MTAQPTTFVLNGQRLRSLRRQRGLSQEKLADQAGVSLTTVARLERQACAPCRGRTLGRLARALDKHPATLTHGQPAGHRTSGAGLQAALAETRPLDEQFDGDIAGALTSAISGRTNADA